jgi:DNA-directed RNA polymerase specialized sigma24 family protein
MAAETGGEGPYDGSDLRLRQQRLADLYEDNFGRMLRMARGALSGADDTLAEDLVQTVFVEAAAASRRPGADPPGEGWLYLRLRARIADHFRSARAQQTLSRQEPVLNGPDAAAEYPGELVTERLYEGQLLAAVPDPLDRAVLEQTLAGYNLSYSRRQVRDRLKRARRYARQWMAPEPRQPTNSGADGRRR